MNVNAYECGTLVLVDELETGLEPYRISTLINQLRMQFKDSGQLILTTHSRSVVCECDVKELCVVNNSAGELVMEEKSDCLLIRMKQPYIKSVLQIFMGLSLIT